MPRRTSSPSDPRDVITPDAFSVAPELLGLPLARPRRRFGAILADLILIGILSQAGILLLGVAAGIFFLRSAYTRSGGGLVFKSFRVLVGCFGVFILLVTVTIGGSVLFLRTDEGRRVARNVGRDLARDAVARLDSADYAALDPETRSLLDSLVGSGASEEAQAEADSVVPPGETGTAPADTDAASAGAVPVSKLLTLIGALQERTGELEEEVTEMESRLAEEEEGGSAILNWILGIVDDLGLAFGWGGLYMTVFLSWWNGRTPGKWLFGVRVVQLDATPISWWEAFERSGGYAAGLATGLLGFAQVWWDPNRQAIHDKIASTVVVRAPRRSTPLPERENAGAS